MSYVVIINHKDHKDHKDERTTFIPLVRMERSR